MIDGRRFLGVLDCAEPLAGAAFLARLAAAGDRSGGVPAILWSDSAGSPESPRDGGAAAPASVLLALHTLERMGVDAVVMPGAGAHAWYRDLCAAAHVPVMHIVECAAADLRRVRPPGSRIAALSVHERAGAGLYGCRLRRLRFDVMETPEATAARMAEAAQLIERGDAPSADRLVRACIEELARAGATAVVLACAEVSCATPTLRSGRGSERTPVPVIDPLDSLARAAASWARGASDAWDLVADIPEEEPEPAAAPPA